MGGNNVKSAREMELRKVGSVLADGTDTADEFLLKVGSKVVKSEDFGYRSKNYNIMNKNCNSLTVAMLKALHFDPGHAFACGANTDSTRSCLAPENVEVSSPTRSTIETLHSILSFIPFSGSVVPDFMDAS